MKSDSSNILSSMRPDSINLLFLRSSCTFMKWETENNLKKIEFFLKLLYFHAYFCLFFLLFLFLSLSTLINGSGKDPRNNKSIESGLKVLIKGCHSEVLLCVAVYALHVFVHHVLGGIRWNCAAVNTPIAPITIYQSVSSVNCLNIKPIDQWKMVFLWFPGKCTFYHGQTMCGDCDKWKFSGIYDCSVWSCRVVSGHELLWCL